MWDVVLMLNAGGGAAVFLCTSSAAGAPVRQRQDAAELGGASP